MRLPEVRGHRAQATLRFQPVEREAPRAKRKATELKSLPSTGLRDQVRAVLWCIVGMFRGVSMFF